MIFLTSTAVLRIRLRSEKGQRKTRKVISDLYNSISRRLSNSERMTVTEQRRTIIAQLPRIIVTDPRAQAFNPQQCETHGLVFYRVIRYIEFVWHNNTLFGRRLDISKTIIAKVINNTRTVVKIIFGCNNICIGNVILFFARESAFRVHFARIFVRTTIVASS